MGPQIREVAASDLDALYEVCLRTGDAGNDATVLYEDPRLLGEVYVGPYVMLAGTIGFTAVDDDGPAGYALAALDTRSFEERCEEEWWPALRASHPDPRSHPANPDEEIAALIHRPPRAPDAVVEEYPAHLHIDLLPRLQGKGVGRALMERLLDALDEQNVVGVHLEVAPGNRRAIGFYQHLGFSRLTGHRGGVFMGLRLAEVGQPMSSGR
jgi:ribosomal protein S18 acetylase RimI-like enzyme